MAFSLLLHTLPSHLVFSGGYFRTVVTSSSFRGIDYTSFHCHWLNFSSIITICLAQISVQCLQKVAGPDLRLILVPEIYPCAFLSTWDIPIPPTIVPGGSMSCKLQCLKAPLCVHTRYHCLGVKPSVTSFPAIFFFFFFFCAYTLASEISFNSMPVAEIAIPEHVFHAACFFSSRRLLSRISPCSAHFPVAAYDHPKRERSATQTQGGDFPHGRTGIHHDTCRFPGPRLSVSSILGI